MGFSIESDRNVQVSSLDEMALTDGLVLYYTMDSIDGSTLLDNSGNNYHGTVYGATPTTGINGNALSFNGVDNKVVSSSFSLSTTITVSGWIKPIISSTKEVFIHGNAGGSSYEFYQSGINMTLKGSGTSSISWGTLSLNNWNFICGVIDNTTATIYINNTTTSGTVTALSNTTNQFAIGSYIAGNYFFNGLIDEVRIYNRALSAAEVKQLYKLNAPTTVASIKENQ